MKVIEINKYFNEEDVRNIKEIKCAFFDMETKFGICALLKDNSMKTIALFDIANN